MFANNVMFVLQTTLYSKIKVQQFRKKLWMYSSLATFKSVKVCAIYYYGLIGINVDSAT